MSFKRAHQASQERPSKRLKAPGGPIPTADDIQFNSAFSDELVLLIFSYLPFQDLCVVQSVDNHWARLASDNSLWKRLFLTDHPSQRLRGSRGFSSRWVMQAGREIKTLPARLKNTNDQTDYWPFKWMYR